MRKVSLCPGMISTKLTQSMVYQNAKVRYWSLRKVNSSYTCTMIVTGFKRWRNHCIAKSYGYWKFMINKKLNIGRNWFGRIAFKAV